MLQQLVITRTYYPNSSLRTFEHALMLGTQFFSSFLGLDSNELILMSLISFCLKINSSYLYTVFSFPLSISHPRQFNSLSVSLFKNISSVRAYFCFVHCSFLSPKKEHTLLYHWMTEWMAVYTWTRSKRNLFKKWGGLHCHNINGDLIFFGDFHR